ncbi:MAG: hypothetical protein AAGU27_23610, partial [Dehalobacterium sp.]
SVSGGRLIYTTVFVPALTNLWCDMRNGSTKKKRIWNLKKSPTAKQLPSYSTSVVKSMLKQRLYPNLF